MLSACIKDPCAGVFCSAQGECINGVCFCEEKYTGESCVSYARYFSGDYLVHSSCVDTLYEVTIDVFDSTLDTILISNFLNLNTIWNLEAWVENDSTIKGLGLATVFEDTMNNTNTFYTINKPFVIKGKPTDTLTTTITYFINNTDSTCIEMYIKQ